VQLRLVLEQDDAVTPSKEKVGDGLDFLPLQQVWRADDRFGSTADEPVLLEDLAHAFVAEAHVDLLEEVVSE
jgi:hypothetical protein